MANDPIYNTIGTTYNSTRTADPYIAGRLYHLLAPTAGGQYLDIGCGTGNYLKALTEMGVHFTGVDPSETMLASARKNNPDTTFICAKAEALPFEDEQFDGGMATFTLHHWDDMAAGIREISRIMKPGAHVVFLSFTPEQMDQYWLMHYFPKMIKDSGALVPSEADMTALFKSNGFSTVTTEKYFVHEELTDHFLFSNKYRPEQYLDPKVRSGASSFRVFVSDEELNQGLKKLEADIQTGEVQSVIDRYESDMGDYLFYRITK